MKALCVFSGGLDSMLSAELIRAQGIDVLALFFQTPFFTSGRAEKSAHSMGLALKVVDITKRHLEVVRNPKHGYGGNMNPCIDCHALMCRIAGEMLDEEEADFVVTGEVLGQRPMSQNRKSLALVATESGLDGLLLRPLCAKHLPVTIPEKKGWVDRERLMDFQGRSRKPQIALAGRLNIKHYPSPAGGCLLTEAAFSKRLKDLFSSDTHIEVDKIELLKVGRHFRIGPETKLIVGRNRQENEIIRSLASHDDLLLTTMSTPGPTVLVSGPVIEGLLEQAAAITVAYSDVVEGEERSVRVESGGNEKVLHTRARHKQVFRGYLI